MCGTDLKRTRAECFEKLKGMNITFRRGKTRKQSNHSEASCSLYFPSFRKLLIKMAKGRPEVQAGQEGGRGGARQETHRAALYAA